MTAASRTLISVTRLVLILVALDLFSGAASAHPGVRKIAANGRSTMVATLDQMPGAR